MCKNCMPKSVVWICVGVLYEKRLAVANLTMKFQITFSVHKFDAPNKVSGKMRCGDIAQR